MSKIELKPCPFCGGEPEVERYGTQRVSCIVKCTECHCVLESPDRGAGDSWNERITVKSNKTKIETIQCPNGCKMAIIQRVRHKLVKATSIIYTYHCFSCEQIFEHHCDIEPIVIKTVVLGKYKPRIHAPR